MKTHFLISLLSNDEIEKNKFIYIYIKEKLNSSYTSIGPWTF
jgi:hypothetical protein